MFQRGNLTVLRVRGVPIRLHFSVLLLVPFLAFVISAQTPRIAQLAGLPTAAQAAPGWLYGLLAAVGLLVSITIHELAHTLIAIHYGGRVESIVLMALGGVSQISRMPRKPSQELVMAAAGPLTSIALAFLFGFAYRATVATPAIAFVLFLLAYLNLVLGIFNLLPAFPMDGGRVLRAALAWRLGKARATRIAAFVGKTMAALFAIFGLFGGGIWMILIAFFVWSGASQEKLYSDLQTSLSDLKVGEVQHLTPQVHREETAEAARNAMRDAGADSAVVVERGQTIGVVRKADLLRLPPPARMVETVGAHMLEVQALAGSEELGESFDRILREGELPVVDEAGQPLGVVRSADVMRALRERGFRFPGEPRQPPNGAPPQS